MANRLVCRRWRARRVILQGYLKCLGDERTAGGCDCSPPSVARKSGTGQGAPLVAAPQAAAKTKEDGEPVTAAAKSAAEPQVSTEDRRQPQQHETAGGDNLPDPQGDTPQ